MPRALVVDDSRAMRAIVGRIMEDAGFEVFSAGDGREALEWVYQNGPADIALVDWNMPRMSGYDLVCAVRADACYNPMRIMMVTTNTEITQMTKALAVGADEYIMKPFTREAFLEKLALLKAKL